MVNIFEQQPSLTTSQNFIAALTTYFNSNKLIKITIGNVREKKSYLKNVFVKPVKIKDTIQLSFLYRYLDKDVTKNMDLATAIITIENLLKTFFLNAELYSADCTIYYTENNLGKTKLVIKKLANAIPHDIAPHDKVKHRYIKPEAEYLKVLGVSTSAGKVKTDMQHKYKQINKFVEIIESIIGKDTPQKKISIVDMGSGKGYLTFALYDYLHTNEYQVTIIGVEQRAELVNMGNTLARHCNYDGLLFEMGSIQSAAIADIDMLIALHACDTATDDAIAKGILANAKYIICAPCCHKQVRKQMAPINAIQSITKHGILLERQAEIITDSIRALMLEAYGYKTKVFDFIDIEHTPKNLLIVGTKKIFNKAIFDENLKKIKELKALFNLTEHYLETIIGF